MDMSSLNNPSNYPHEVDQIEWRETHISWVILTGKFVYKIKKPVDFGFLNFSSLSLRKTYCEEELRLNRRTAPSLYLDVVCLCDNHGQLNFNGLGQVVDYAVKMCQFDPDALLSNKLKVHAPSKEFIQTLAYDLAQFHEQAACAGEGFDVLQSVSMPVIENFRQIRQNLSDTEATQKLDWLEAWSMNALKELESTFFQRFKMGRVRECHGDLHLGNIAVLDDKPIMFDCIEFNEQFRWIDCASDLAFLLMDLQFNGYADVANRVLNRYLEFSFDYPSLAVMDFYRVYRSMVRAKVALLRASQSEIESSAKAVALQQFHDYLQFAQDAVSTKSAFLVLTSGVSGSGKSTFASNFCAYTNAIHIKSDVVRKRLAGLAPLQGSEELVDLNLYSTDYSKRTSDQLLSITKSLLALDYGVVVDATFLEVAHRKPFLDLALEQGVGFALCHLSAPLAVLTARIEARQRSGLDPSEATVAVMTDQQKHVQPFTQSELPYLVEITDTCHEESFPRVMAVLVR